MIFLSGYFNKLYKNIIIIIQKTFKTQIQQLSGGTLNFENLYNKKFVGQNLITIAVHLTFSFKDFKIVEVGLLGKYCFILLSFSATRQEDHRLHKVFAPQVFL